MFDSIDGALTESYFEEMIQIKTHLKKEIESNQFVHNESDLTESNVYIMSVSSTRAATRRKCSRREGIAHRIAAARQPGNRSHHFTSRFIATL